MQFARAVFLIGAGADARLVGDIDVLGLIAIDDRDRLHHDLPDRLLVLGVFEVIIVRVHLPVVRRLRHGPLVLSGLLRLFPDGGLLRDQRIQIEHVFAVLLFAFIYMKRKHLPLALLARVVSQLHAEHIAARLRLPAVRHQAVPGHLAAAGLYARAAYIRDRFARLAAEQLHRQRARLRRAEGKIPAVLTGDHRHVVRGYAGQLRRGQRAGRDHRQDQQHKPNACFHVLLRDGLSSG